MSIGDNLRVIRAKRGVSQLEAADFLGIDRKTYVSWEANEAEIKSSHIPKLAELFNVKIEDLFREKAGDIVISPHNSDNKDSSINAGVVLILTDKEAIDQVFDVLKRFKKE